MATVPSEISWTVGQVVTAAQLNSNVRDAVNFVITPVLFIGRQSAATQSTTSGSWTSILLDLEEIDRDNGHSTTTNTSRYTAQTAGYYQVDGIVAWSSNSTGARATKLTVNGANVAGRAVSWQAAGSLLTASQVSAPVYLNVGDYVETQGNQVSGGALNTSINADFTSMMSCLWVST